MRPFDAGHPATLCSVVLFVLIVAGCYLQFYDVVEPVFQHVIESVKAETEQGVLIPLHPADHIHREAQRVELQWNITQGYRRPDGVKKLVYLINGQFPGPTIELRSGDSLSVTVHNTLENDEGVAIHWHGLYMRDANDMDGAVAITQNSTQPGDSFTYDFDIADDQAGTFWYHSHSELQRTDGLYGGLVVHDPRSDAIQGDWTEEALLMVGDWYHRSAQDVQQSYVTYKSWGMEPVPDSLLVNGRGAFNCSMAVPSRPLDCRGQDRPIIRGSAERQRLRIANVGAMSGVTLRIPGAEMLPLAIDGGNPVSTSEPVSSMGILYPGERLDVAIRWDTEHDSYLHVELDDENYQRQNMALTPVHQFPVLASRRVTELPSRRIPQSKLGQGHFNLSKASGNALGQPLQALPDQIVLIYTKIEMLSHFANVPMGFLNRTSWAPQARPLTETHRAEWDDNQLVPWISGPSNDTEHKWVDIVVNNLDEKGHPFHLHGHDFYVLSVYKSPAQGYHTYNPFLPSTPPSSPDLLGGPYNLADPPKKDTVYIPRMGYAVLRFRADNPGIWFFHCHILWHQGTGMAMALQVGGDPP